MNRAMAGELLEALDSPNDNVVNTAVLALACLEDFRCVPRLVELLAAGSATLRASAHHALCRLLDKHTVNSVGVWRHWYKTEAQWLRTSGARALADLRSRQEAKVLDALEVIAAHRLERHRMALDVSLVLRNESLAVRLAACKTLTGLNSRWAVHDLREALLDDSPLLVEAAGLALQSITGERREATYEAWQDYPAPTPSHY